MDLNGRHNGSVPMPSLTFRVAMGSSFLGLRSGFGQVYDIACTSIGLAELGRFRSPAWLNGDIDNLFRQSASSQAN